jgi:hypothetical protein
MDVDDDDEEATVLAAYMATVILLLYYLDEDERIPYHTSALTGIQWVIELLEGHPERIRCELGVHKEVFEHLIKHLHSAGLHSSRKTLIEEQLAIFLYTCVTGLSFRHVAERFQRSTSTISM